MQEVKKGPQAPMASIADGRVRAEAGRLWLLPTLPRSTSGQPGGTVAGGLASNVREIHRTSRRVGDPCYGGVRL